MREEMQIAAALSLTALLCPNGESKVRRVDPSTSYSPAINPIGYASAQMEYRVERSASPRDFPTRVFSPNLMSYLSLYLTSALRPAPTHLHPITKPTRKGRA